MPYPTTTKAWIVANSTDGFAALRREAQYPVAQLDPTEVLVHMKAASLNYRDLAIPQGKYPFPLNLPVVATSDGAGEIIAVGSKVSEFKVGDRVMTLFHQGHQAGPLDGVTMRTGLGGALDGALREYAVFPETGVVRAPAGLSHEEAASLPCAAVTAWNSLYGVTTLKAGDVVLVQGTGGVSVFALQFAKAAGAFVIATTSSEEKMQRLKAMGADVVINYKTTPNWGEVARKSSPGGNGADIVIEVAGEATLPQSYVAVKVEGTIALIGFIGGPGPQSSALDPLANVCTVRGIYVGSRAQAKDMCLAIEANKIKPVVDATVFDFEQAKEAYQHQLDQKHFGKVVIRI